MIQFDALAKAAFCRLLELSDPLVNEELASAVDVQLTNREMEALSFLADGLTSNKKAAALLKVPKQEALRNHSIHAVLRYGVHRSVIAAHRVEVIQRQLDDLVAGRESRTLVCFSESLYLEFTARRRS